MELIILIAGLLLLFVGIYLRQKITKIYVRSRLINSISIRIKSCSSTYLDRQYRVILPVIFIIAGIIFLFLDNSNTAVNEGAFLSLSFIWGSFFSLLSSYYGMDIATSANGKTTNAARKSIKDALKVSFLSGLSMSSFVLSFAIIGLVLMYYIYIDFLQFSIINYNSIIIGFGLGASTVALFARVAGGIFTKASDIASDITGKLENKLTEDDPRNPAVVADNVGDNVGDISGMSSDLFESYVGSIIAAIVIGSLIFKNKFFILIPMVLALIGIVSSLFGSYFVKLTTKKQKIDKQFQKSLFIASTSFVILSFILLKFILNTALLSFSIEPMNIFYCLISGLFAGYLIGLSTNYYTSYNFTPVKQLAKSANAGIVNNILYGISLGYMSTAFPIILICVAIFISYFFLGLYGISLAAIGMLSTLYLSLAIDGFGPVVDNAGGIAQQASLSYKVRKNTDILDAAGNTTAAISKGFAIGSAALTALALFSAYAQSATITSIDLLDYKVLIGILLGALLPFVFSSLIINAVSATSATMVYEVRNQLKRGVLKKNKKPDYNRLVDIATQASLRKMVLPSAIAILSPLLVGFFLSKAAVGGLLTGSLATGVLLALSMANSGSAWDNAKKYIALNYYGGKRTKQHDAAVVGDTIGDPLKDACGPSLNILIKLIAIVSLVFLPVFI